MGFAKVKTQGEINQFHYSCLLCSQSPQQPPLASAVTWVPLLILSLTTCGTHRVTLWSCIHCLDEREEVRLHLVSLYSKGMFPDIISRLLALGLGLSIRFPHFPIGKTHLSLMEYNWLFCRPYSIPGFSEQFLMRLKLPTPFLR